MADGVRVATVRRGVDPQAVTRLLAFGGAAGLHITAVAAELGIARVAVPLAASVLSAWGMLNTDLRVELSRSQGQAGAIDTAGLKAAFAEMEAEGRARLAWFDGEVTLHRSADMRYGEQVFEIAVPLDGVDWNAADLGDHPGRPVSCRARGALHLRIARSGRGTGQCAPVGDRAVAAGGDARSPTRRRPTAAPKSRRQVYLRGLDRTCRCSTFSGSGADQHIVGPAVIESDTTTVLLRDRRYGTIRSRAAGWMSPLTHRPQTVIDPRQLPP